MYVQKTLPTDIAYNVVLKRKNGKYEGVITWTSYENKAQFETDRARIEQNYEILAEGVTQEIATGYCLSPEAIQAVIDSGYAEIDQLLEQATLQSTDHTLASMDSTMGIVIID